VRKKLPFARKESSDYRYSESVAEAVKWLGDRYLLARPIRIACSVSWRQAHDPRGEDRLLQPVASIGKYHTPIKPHFRFGGTQS
jgi:hypothetical protein